MMKWKLSAFFGVGFGIAGIGWGYAQAPAPTGFFELRVYTALPGKRDALAARFANRTAAIYARHGITNVGYGFLNRPFLRWTSLLGTPSSTCAGIRRERSGTNA